MAYDDWMEEWLAEEYERYEPSDEMREAGRDFRKTGSPRSALAILRHYEELEMYHKVEEWFDIVEETSESVEDIFFELTGWEVYFDERIGEWGGWRDAETGRFVSEYTVLSTLEHFGYTREELP